MKFYKKAAFVYNTGELLIAEATQGKHIFFTKHDPNRILADYLRQFKYIAKSKSIEDMIGEVHLGFDDNMNAVVAFEYEPRLPLKVSLQALCNMVGSDSDVIPLAIVFGR